MRHFVHVYCKELKGNSTRPNLLAKSPPGSQGSHRPVETQIMMRTSYDYLDVLLLYNIEEQLFIVLISK